ncbi:MAG: restriction endonuclease [Candidatus Yanofskybacteria bacterium CG10_big_fil_rev_8_21_14_0_10_37_15]|uniref:Restriction endonuclease n=1 Tax=Candidatus Yanofskybacteria bacterium CG10_big_fil_rev_8_21_14_0_10_37_15 TaxID=1975097 RepID=A0A2H0R622_9BACT|nr:MAG: restriction endonuclease [Candidatus Yanofskybacteria bacterium CG10_big_fil_rev_8_21_14_0_10_37_15]
MLIKEREHKIEVPILLTAVSGKIRVKNRSIVNEYGTPVAVKREGFALSNYVEWQIGYDVVKRETEKLADSSLPETEFTGANGKTKALYELSEYIWYFHKWGVISREELESIINYLNAISNNDLIDNNSELQIDRSHPIVKNINGFEFEYTQVKYPLLIHKFNGYEIVTEIKITEKQYAVGTQPMLYLCFPITELNAMTNLIGRTAETKEIAYFEITGSNIKVFLEMLKMFGTLSNNHKHDILQIINTILV